MGWAARAIGAPRVRLGAPAAAWWRRRQLRAVHHRLRVRTAIGLLRVAVLGISARAVLGISARAVWHRVHAGHVIHRVAAVGIHAHRCAHAHRPQAHARHHPHRRVHPDRRGVHAVHAVHGAGPAHHRANDGAPHHAPSRRESPSTVPVHRHPLAAVSAEAQRRHAVRRHAIRHAVHSHVRR